MNWFNDWSLTFWLEIETSLVFFVAKVFIEVNRSLLFHFLLENCRWLLWWRIFKWYGLVDVFDFSIRWSEAFSYTNTHFFNLWLLILGLTRRLHFISMIITVVKSVSRWFLHCIFLFFFSWWYYSNDLNFFNFC